LRSGRLVQVLEKWAAAPLGIYAVYPQRRHLALRVRLLLDYFRDTYARADYWSS
jgi:DNA-binding transcriptional LysR family regulator